MLRRAGLRRQHGGAHGKCGGAPGTVVRKEGVGGESGRSSERGTPGSDVREPNTGQIVKQGTRRTPPGFPSPKTRRERTRAARFHVKSDHAHPKEESKSDGSLMHPSTRAGGPVVGRSLKDERLTTIGNPAGPTADARLIQARREPSCAKPLATPTSARRTKARQNSTMQVSLLSWRLVFRESVSGPARILRAPPCGDALPEKLRTL